MLKTIRKHGITLALFAAGSTGLTAVINQMTKSTIHEQALQQQHALFDQVLPPDRYNNNLQEAVIWSMRPPSAKAHTVFLSLARMINP